jgi:hypothetical protein
MRTIKVQCGCGQRYAFDVEPAARSMPYSVACPICGTDGTSAANEIIANSLLQTQPVVAVAPSGLSFSASAETSAPPPVPVPVGGGLRVRATVPDSNVALSTSSEAASTTYVPPAASPGAGRPQKLLPGQVPRPQAETEGRAKIFWGDPPEEVVKFLMRNGISHPEASELTRGYYDERAKAVRSKGFGKILTGIGMICVPLIALAIFLHIRFIPWKLFAITIMVGLYGLWRLFHGTVMVIAPKFDKGDVADL